MGAWIQWRIDGYSKEAAIGRWRGESVVTPVLIYGLLCRVEGGGEREINCPMMIYRFASGNKSSGWSY